MTCTFDYVALGLCSLVVNGQNRKQVLLRGVEKHLFLALSKGAAHTLWTFFSELIQKLNH